MKKTIAIVLSLFILFAASACSILLDDSGKVSAPDKTSTESSDDNKETSTYKSYISGSGLIDDAYKGAQSTGGLLKRLYSIPEYNDNGDRMFIYTFQEPRGNSGELDDACKNIAECGFDACFTWGYKHEYISPLKKYNVASVPYLSGITPQKTSNDLLPENISDTIKGFFYKDEPSFDEMKTVIKPNALNHSVHYKDKLFFVNLNPYWEGNETNENSFHLGHTYDEYISEFCGQAYGYIDHDRIISVDFYPLMQDGTQRDVWLYTYETIAKYAKECDATFHFFIPSTEHYGYRKLNLENLRYMVNVGLTYGGSAMSYFTYLTYDDQTSFEHGLVSSDGLTKYDTYYMAQTVNNECLMWDHIFMNFKWQDTMFVSGTEERNTNSQFIKAKNSVDNIALIESVSASRDTIIGEFLGDNDEIGLMVTNFCDPFKGATDKVVLNIKEANKAILYLRGQKSIVDVNDGILKLSITPGDAIFVVPLVIA